MRLEPFSLAVMLPEFLKCLVSDQTNFNYIISTAWCYISRPRYTCRSKKMCLKQLPIIMIHMAKPRHVVAMLFVTIECAIWVHLLRQSNTSLGKKICHGSRVYFSAFDSSCKTTCTLSYHCTNCTYMVRSKHTARNQETQRAVEAFASIAVWTPMPRNHVGHSYQYSQGSSMIAYFSWGNFKNKSKVQAWRTS